MTSADDIVRIARSWIGTPYHHQASVRGVGCDCLGLVRGVWVEAVGYDPETPPAYAADWADATGDEAMLRAAGRHLSAKAIGQAAPGDVLVFRLRPGFVAKHAAILATDVTMIHAVEGVPVGEVALTPWWRRRIAGVFAFPSRI
ncbi:MAG: peptidase P60 [Rhodospirillales bacterium]|nr:peptidase P60 [Rhodospirillales bacterium]